MVDPDGRRPPCGKRSSHSARVFGSWGRRVAIVERMTIQRMEHVGIVVDDLEAATAFFVELGLEGQVEGGWSAVQRLGAYQTGLQGAPG